MAARKTTSPARTRSESTAEHHRVRRQQHETEAAQDYCEAIAELLDAGVEARVGRIAERFGLSHVTVSRVVRRLAVEGFEVARLGDFEGKGDASLLALGGEGGGFQAVEGNFEVVAVGASDGLAESLLLPARGGETFGKGAFTSGLVSERERIG